MSISLFSLSKDVFHGSILPFLSLRCIASLDCAVASKSQRPDLIEFFSQSHFDQNTVFPVNACSSRWAEKRKFRFDHVYFPTDVRENDCCDLSHIMVRATQFDYSDSYLNAECVIKLLKQCPSLRLLRRCVFQQLNDLQLGEITRQHRSLLSLQIGHYDLFTEAALETIAQNCTELQELNITLHPYFYGETIIKMVSCLPRLKSLEMIGLHVSEQELCKIADFCPLLSYIGISKSTNISSASTMIHLAQKCPLLTRISLPVSEVLIVASLAEALPQLQEIRIRFLGIISSSGIQTIAKHCTQLRSVSVTGYQRGLDDAALVALAQGCPLLTHLDAIYSSPTISDHGVIARAQACTQLSEIKLAKCLELTDAAVIALAQNCPLLTDLNLSGCRLLTDNAITNLAVHCRFLTSLLLQRCELLTDKTLQSLAMHCPHVTKLSMSACHKISSTGLIALSLGCKKLRNLGVDDCGLICDTGAIALVQHVRSLRHLDLRRCSLVTDAFVEAVLLIEVKLVWVGVAMTSITQGKLNQLSQHIGQET